MSKPIRHVLHSDCRPYTGKLANVIKHFAFRCASDSPYDTHIHLGQLLTSFFFHVFIFCVIYIASNGPTSYTDIINARDLGYNNVGRSYIRHFS